MVCWSVQSRAWETHHQNQMSPSATYERTFSTMAKSGSGDIAGAGRRKGEFVRWDEGLTEGDKRVLVEVESHLNEVISKLDVAFARGLEAIGIEAESDAAAICPVDTGRLRNTITHTIDNGGRAAIIGTHLEYAQWVHNGTSRQQAQPFLTDAVTANSDKYRRIFEAAMRT